MIDFRKDVWQNRVMAKRAARTGRPPLSDEGSATIGVKVASSEKARMMAVSSNDGRSLSNWARIALLKALAEAEAADPSSLKPR